MTTSNYFEYSRRWPQIHDLLKDGNETEAVHALEERDRDFENWTGALQGPTAVGAGINWLTVTDESGTSLGNFYHSDGPHTPVTDTGTWAVSGSAIRQSASDGVVHTAIPSTVTNDMTAIWAAAVELKADGGWTSYSGLSLHSKILYDDATPVARWGPYIGVRNGEDVTDFSLFMQNDYDGGSGVEREISLGTRDTDYHTLALFGSGPTITIYWDGAWVTNYSSFTQYQGGYGVMFDRVALVSKQGNVPDHGPRYHYFQNFKVWTLDLVQPFTRV